MELPIRFLEWTKAYLDPAMESIDKKEGEKGSSSSNSTEGWRVDPGCSRSKASELVWVGYLYTKKSLLGLNTTRGILCPTPFRPSNGSKIHEKHECLVLPTTKSIVTTILHSKIPDCMDLFRFVPTMITQFFESSRFNIFQKKALASKGLRSNWPWLSMSSNSKVHNLSLEAPSLGASFNHSSQNTLFFTIQ